MFDSSRMKTIVLIVVMITTHRTELYAQEPQDNSLAVTFDVADRKVQVTFRFCPAGVLVPGQPKPDAPKSEPTTGSDLLGNVGGPVPIDGFYISQTEVTTKQFADALGEEDYARFREPVKKKLSGAKEDVALLDSPGNYPAFMIGSNDAIRFCQQLQAASVDKQIGSSRIEERRIRLPSHYEWQYACRAGTTTARAGRACRRTARRRKSGLWRNNWKVWCAMSANTPVVSSSHLQS